jgi:hypothetical protein
MVSGICGSLLSWAGGNANSVGASGGIFGLMGAAIVFGFRFQKELPPMAGELFRKTSPPVRRAQPVHWAHGAVHRQPRARRRARRWIAPRALPPEPRDSRKEGTLAGTIATAVIGGGLLLVGLLGVFGVLR